MSLKDKFEELPDDIESNDIKELRSAMLRLQKQLKQAKERTEDLVHTTHQAAFDAMLTFGKITPVKDPVKDKRESKPEVALWHMTDWQGAKRPSYNSEVMRKRVLEFCEKAVRITDIQRKDHPVKEVYVCFGGDMVEGLFNFPGQAFEVDSTLFEQYVNVSRLLIYLIKNITPIAKRYLFEFNNSITRTSFINSVIPIMEQAKSTGGLIDYTITCDDSNNTDAVISANNFVADIKIKPAKAINYITLRFTNLNV
jgi:hypothetical protein